MFMDEARLAGVIEHPNVVSVIDVGEDDEGPFLVMDFVDGLALSALVRQAGRRERRLPVRVCLDIAEGMASGLSAAHDAKGYDGKPLCMVHRDLSPQNVLIGWDGSVRITDFGIAKAVDRSTRTATGVLKGKLSYMAPEVLRFEDPDHRSDLFALGVVMFECLSGTRLYRNIDGKDGVRRILHEPPPDIGEIRADVPAPMVELLLELLSKSPDERPESAAHVVARLQAIGDEVGRGEGGATLADVMSEFAGEEREKAWAALSPAIARAESEERTLTKANAGSAGSKRFVIFATFAALGMVAAIAFAIGVMTQPGAEVDPEPIADGRAPELQQAESASSLEGSAGSETVSAEDAVAGSEQVAPREDEADPVVAEDPVPQIVRPRRRRARRPMREPEPPAAQSPPRSRRIQTFQGLGGGEPP